jgi:two-component system response regulator YesN
LSKFKTIESFVEYISQKIKDIRNSDVNSHKSNTERMLEGTINYVIKNYADPMLSLEKVCGEMNVSVSHLSMLLKKKKGITFNKFLIKIRLDKAIELLKTTDMKIADISNVCGYNEVYYFSHSFKKYTGVPPGEYRKNALV